MALDPCVSCIINSKHRTGERAGRGYLERDMAGICRIVILLCLLRGLSVQMRDRYMYMSYRAAWGENTMGLAAVPVQFQGPHARGKTWPNFWRRGSIAHCRDGTRSPPNPIPWRAPCPARFQDDATRIMAAGTCIPGPASSSAASTDGISARKISARPRACSAAAATVPDGLPAPRSVPRHRRARPLQAHTADWCPGCRAGPPSKWRPLARMTCFRRNARQGRGLQRNGQQ